MKITKKLHEAFNTRLTGHWEGHFKSQALLNESALIACMAYVDMMTFQKNHLTV